MTKYGDFEYNDSGVCLNPVVPYKSGSWNLPHFEIRIAECRARSRVPSKGDAERKKTAFRLFKHEYLKSKGYYDNKNPKTD